MTVNDNGFKKDKFCPLLICEIIEHLALELP